MQQQLLSKHQELQGAHVRQQDLRTDIQVPCQCSRWCWCWTASLRRAAVQDLSTTVVQLERACKQRDAEVLQAKEAATHTQAALAASKASHPLVLAVHCEGTQPLDLAAEPLKPAMPTGG